MDSAIVIKVKHGETLRRLNAHVVDGELDMDVDGLRQKILSLFKFSPNAELTLTYVDEDNDIVTIGDDEDLHDAVRQGLNPLRITVKLSTESSGGKTYSRSSGSSTPLRSPQVPQPLQNFNYNIFEFLKSVPEPIRKRIMKLCADMASTGTTSGPSFSEVLQCFAEAGLPYLKLLSEFQGGPASSDSIPQDVYSWSPGGSDAPSKSNCPGNTTYETPAPDANGSKVNGLVLPNEKPERKPSKGNKDDTPPEAEDKTSAGVTAGSNGSVARIPGLESLKAALDSVNACGSWKETVGMAMEPESSSSLKTSSGKKKDASKATEWFKPLKPVNSSSVDSAALENAASGDRKSTDKHDVNLVPRTVKINVVPPSFAPATGKLCNLNSQPVDGSAGAKNVFSGSLGNTSGPNLVPSTTSECAFTGLPVGETPAGYIPCVVQPRRSRGHRDGSGIIFHRGVRCDGCGIHPITGPRYKSKVTEDYDLCSMCFSQVGIESDYIRIDRPVSYRHPFTFKGLYDFHNRVPPPEPHVFKGCGVKPVRQKLDSRFIQDVNFLDGTFIAPSVSFTKIWRMRNNGNVMWPQGTQLVWIGGDKLSDTFAVELEIAGGGLPVDHELDVTVDFTAPDRPGRYISYWRMASPSGQKFGQRVWVLIQVDASLREFPAGGFRGFNLNLPPVANVTSGSENLNVNQEAVIDDAVILPELFQSNSTTELVEPMVNVARKEQEVNFPINDSLFVSSGFSQPVSSVPSSAISYPIIDLSEVASAPPAVSGGQTSTQDVSEHADVEGTLLKDLEEMGFKQVDLNKEILRLNEYDLEKSVDDLCGVSEWDPILEELREMGFCDDETNRALLKKNNGSIKRVVMDLLSKEKM